MDEEKMIPTVGGEDAGYLFEFKPEGVFLTVYPSGDTGILFELSDMRQVLKEYGVLDYDIELLARTVREAAGKPQKLAEHFEAPVASAGDSELQVGSSAEQETAEGLLPAKFNLIISKDRMRADVHVDYEAGRARPGDEEIMQALQDKGVTFGINMQAIQQGLENGTDFTAAQGTPPVHGEDATIERKFNLGVKGAPVVNKYDRVDYKNLNLFVLVKKGDILAIRVPQTQGTPGKNIFGDDVAAKHGKPKPLPNGKNTTVVDDNTVVANMDGQIVDSGSKINVDPQLAISGDVGISTGNIDFVGAVRISGSVEAGFVVKATGDIEVKGMVSGATIEGENVFISGGVQGMNRGKIIARGDVRATFAENAVIEAGANIFITDAALHSDLQAGKKLVVEGRRGQITGGACAAGEEIRATVVGNQMNVSTRLSVGINPMLQRKYQETCKDYAESKKRLSQLTKALNTLGKLDIAKLPPERVEQINALTMSQFPLAGKVERDERTIRQLEEEMKNMARGKVYVADIVYPGVKLKINSLMKTIQLEQRRCSFYVDEDNIKTGPY